MKLYFSPGTCSLAPHIILREIGIKFDLIKVDLATKLTEDATDFTKINPQGSVPALQLDNNEILTEGVAIMQYLVDQHPEVDLAPMNGTFERARLYECLNYLSAEFHKSFVPLFSKSTDNEIQKAIINIHNKLDFIEILLSDRFYLVDNKLSIADIYLFVVASWTKLKGIGLDNWPNISALSEKIATRESVQEAMQVEGLLN